MDRHSTISPSALSRISAFLLTSLFAAALLTGCASTPSEEDTASTPPPPAAEPAPPPAADEAVAPPPASAPVYQSEERPVRLNPRHPDRYVVKKGDTLWDISEMFLKDPWYWPEIWYVNPQIANPHLIYPGDVITLVYIDGKPRLVLERGNVERLSPRVRETMLGEAIETIPYELIKAFLSKPSVLDKDTVENSPYIFTTRHGHLVHGAGANVYVRGADFALDDVYNVMRVGSKLEDPDTGDFLGYEGIFVGEGTIHREGDPATLLLNATDREALNGDILLTPDEDFPMYFTPRSPDEQIDGKIISVFDGVSIIGAYQIVTLNRGRSQGLEPGHVLAVYQAGRVERDRFSGKGFRGEKVQLPEEYAGLMMVFRSFDRISYGLIVRAESEIHVFDVVRNP
jgi:hypothetical protein